MIRVFVAFTEEPDPARFAQHVEVCRRVPRVTFRHGRVLRTLHGEPKLAYYTEFEFADQAAFDAEGRGEAIRAAGEDAAEMGVPHSVYLVEVD
jgi:hypothetical protein